MTIARRLLVPEGVSRTYHCVSRCVRRAFLCDDEDAHRKDWIRHRLVELNEVFAIEIGAFAIMGNHLHLLLRTRPDRVEAWSDEEVVTRWLRLFPSIGQRLGKAHDAIDDQAIVQLLLADRDRVLSWRQRLGSLSWYMKCLKEPIARRANREDNVTGHFWEGRFKVQSLLDETAVLACMVYIDLNPIRARLAATPEESDHTSVQERIRIRQRYRSPQRGRCVARGSVTIEPKRAEASESAHGNDGLRLIPFRATRDQPDHGDETLVSLTLDEYLQIVDLTGRQVRLEVKGAIPAVLEPILSRLDVDGKRWMSAMLGRCSRIGTSIGSTASLATEAARRGTRWVVGALSVYSQSATV